MANPLAINAPPGRFVWWVSNGCLLMVLLALSILVLRLVLETGRVWLQDALLWLHAALFLAGAWLAMLDDSHVRIEIVRDRLSGKYRRRIEGAGHLLLLIPMMSVILWSSAAPVWRSITQWEGSPSIGGLGGLFLIKALLPLTALAFIIWALQRLRLGAEKV